MALKPLVSCLEIRTNFDVILATKAFQISSNCVEIEMSSTTDRLNVHTKVVLTTEKPQETDPHRTGSLSDSDKLAGIHPPSLNEIQIRAYRIHQKHGAVYGGYSLDDWLEAEHELDKELRESRGKTEQVHSSVDSLQLSRRDLDPC